MLSTIKQHVAQLWKDNRKFVLILACIVGFKSAVADLNSISGHSMQPNLLDGDKVWVNKVAYDISLPFVDMPLLSVDDPERGDIVIIDSVAAGKRLVKRVVGIPGDAVYMRNGMLVVNDEVAAYERVTPGPEDGTTIVSEQLQKHDYQALITAESGRRSVNSHGPMEVPPGHYFVLGDNRGNSADSRVYSFIGRDEIVGRSSSVIFSLDPDKHFLPRTGRFLHALE
ncbi:MAG: signal peptidase I [Pseudohongiellaceae bacterium]